MSHYDLDAEELAKMTRQFQKILDKEYGDGEKNAKEILESYSPVIRVMIECAEELFQESQLMRMVFVRDAILFSTFATAITSGIAELGARQPLKVMILHGALIELLKTTWLLGYTSSRSSCVDDFVEITRMMDMEEEDGEDEVTDEDFKALWGYDDE
jgi:hypothetical protein